MINRNIGSLWKLKLFESLRDIELKTSVMITYVSTQCKSTRLVTRASGD